MPSLRFRTSNISAFVNAEPAYVIGKNGFITQIGTVPILVTSINKADADSNIVFNIRGLDLLTDTNTGVHILDNNTFASQKQITYKVLLNESETEIGDVAFVNPYVEVSSNIVSYFTSNNTIKI